MGGVFKRNTRALSLITKKGICCGVVADSEGEKRKWISTHVLIADGGFQSDKPLFEKYIGGDFDKVFQRGARTGVGDGLKMALDVGAKIVGMDKFYGHLLCADAVRNVNVWPYPELDAIATAGIIVDANGLRVVDEGKSGVYLTNALVTSGSKGPFFVVFDEAIWAEPGSSARIPANPLLEEAGGTVLRAKSLDELGRLIGSAAGKLCETVAAYNVALDNNDLDSLPVPRSKNIKPWKIMQPPFMAIPVCPGITYTMGGIATDRYSQVLDNNNVPIKGLLAAGATTGGLEGGSGAAYIGGLMKSGVFGLVAAEQAAKLNKQLAVKFNAQSGVSSHKKNKRNFVNQSFDRPRGLADFPVLRWVVRYGVFGATSFASVLFIFILLSLGTNIEFWGVVFAGGASLFVAIIGIGFTELIRLITQLLIPK